MRKSKREIRSENGFEIWGGYMNAKIAKLEEQFLEQAAKEQTKTSDLFSGISIFVNGYTKPSSDELKILMAEHGGIYHHYFKSEKTKFIIASNLPDTKIKNLPTTKIIKPEWISESIKAGVLLDYKNFLLYSNYSKTQPRIKFQNTEFSEIDTTNLLKADNDSKGECHLNNILSSFKLSTIDQNILKSETVNPSQSIMSLTSFQPIIPEKDGPSSTRTAVDPKFLSEYYNNSRLHHISQLGAGFKQYVNELRESSDFSFPLRESLKSSDASKFSSRQTKSKEKTVMHIDMDCFFVSVGLCKHPHLRGHPVAVAHSKGGGSRQQKREGVDRKAEFDLYKNKRNNQVKNNVGRSAFLEALENEEIHSRVDGVADDGEVFGSMSEIASCSYEARALGIHNGMFMGPALRLCPDLKTIPYDFEAYKEVAFILYNTVAQYTLDIEAVSCDEMYVECTDLLNEIGLTQMEFAMIIREEIKKKTNCPCSTGFGGNRLQARMATKKAKPDGQFHLQQDEVLSYFANISLSDLPGVGRQMGHKLSILGYTSCSSLRSADLNLLQKHFGSKTGQLLHKYCRGQDDKVLNFTVIRKSISAGVNYGIRFENFQQCETFLKQLCEEVCSRMFQNKIVGKAITFKLMVRAADAPVETAKFMGHGFCENVTKTTNLSQATDNLNVITREVISICKKLNVKPEDMRGIGVQISKLESTVNNCEEKRGGIQNFLKSKSELPNSLAKKLSKPLQENKIIKETQIEPTTSGEVVSDPDLQNQDIPKPSIPNNISSAPIVSKCNATVAVDTVESKIKTITKKKIKSLGLTGKRRGRPPKSASTMNTSGVKERNKSISLFKGSSNNSSRGTEANKYDFQDLDQDFLNALPEDIKSEILANYRVKNVPIRSTKNSHVPKAPENISENIIDPEYLAALPEELRKEVENNYAEHLNRNKQTVDTKPKISENLVSENKVTIDLDKSSTTQESEKDMLNLHWKEVREMSKDWFESTNTPLQQDVDMIIEYVRSLVEKKQIEDLHYLLKFLYRNISEKDSCSWHQVYLLAEVNVQEAMLLAYRKKLKVANTFPCCNP